MVTYLALTTPCSYSDLQLSQDCTFTFELTETLDKPYLYYEIENFYANHRKFVKSRNYKQLRGNVISLCLFLQIVSKSDVSSSCDPITDMGDTGFSASIGGNSLSSDTVANPCGLIAKY